jgi:hypothetical protein
MILKLRCLLTASLISALAASAAQAQQAQRPAAPAATAPKPAAPANATRPAAASPARPPAAATNAAPRPAPNSAAAPAAQPRPATTATSGPAAGANLIATLGDWAVYTAQSGRSKICYALAQPQQRLPAGLNRDPAYLFVSMRPAENVRNEVALVMGFTTRDTAPAEAVIGTTTFALLTKGGSAWLKNPAEEAQAIASMVRGQSLTVRVQSARGNALTDLYSLNGFAQAVDRARRECS